MFELQVEGVAVLIFIWSGARREPLLFSGQEHGFLALQGALIFALNIFFLYLATQLIPSGLNGIVFSMASVISMAAGAIICRRMPFVTSLIGALMGMVGVAVIFLPEIKSLELTRRADLGLLLSLAGTTSLAVSVIVGGRNQKSASLAMGV